MLKLVISDDEGKTMVIPLTRDELTIGRKDGNSIRLTERNVSRRHARIVKRSEGFVLEDLASYNGIVINGARLAEPKPMRGGDQILIGDYKLQVVEEAGAQPTPPPPAPPPAASEHAAPLLAATPSTNPGGAPGLAALNDPLAPASAASAPVPDSIKGMRVVFLAPAGVPAPVMLDRLPMILGRSESADIALAFSSISREHARLFCEEDKLFIEDMGSSNGIQINGEKCRKGELSPGDMVQLGVVEFRVARRGDSTVVIQRAAADERAAAGRSNKGLIAGVVFGGVCLGLLVLFIATHRTGPSPTNPQPDPPAASAAATPTAPTPPPAPAVAPTPPPAAPTTPEAAPAVANPEANPAVPAAAAVPPAATPEPTPPAPTPAAEPTPPPAAPTPPPAAVVAPVEPAPPVAQPLAPDRHARTDRHHTTTTAAPAAPRPATPRPTSAPAAPAPSPAPSAPAAEPGASPMDQARACLRSAPNMNDGNACVVNVLRGRANSESEVGLLCTTYRTMGRTGDAVRCMRNYIQRYPSGARVASFQSYIDGNAP